LMTLLLVVNGARALTYIGAELTTRDGEDARASG